MEYLSIFLNSFCVVILGYLGMDIFRMRGGKDRSPSPRRPLPPAAGYEQYQRSLLEVPWPAGEYGEASSDDLSSEWDSDAPETTAAPVKV